MKLLQINVTANSGSTGKITEDIGKIAISLGWESWIAYGRGKPSSESNLIRIGNDFDMCMHGLSTRFFDNHGLASRIVTKKFIKQIKEIKPDIIHLHNIHGYYINYKILFEFLKNYGVPIVWTWHDIWPITGHCASYGRLKCDKWKSGCQNCPRKATYPATFGISRSKRNYLDKKYTFNSIPNIIIVPVSNWLSDIIRNSYLKDLPVKVIHNGVDLNKFNTLGLKNKANPFVIAVANVWTDDKGLKDLIQLRSVLSKDIKIIIVGLKKNQIKNLPSGIEGLSKTSNFEELKKLYSEAIALINPTWGDNFPTVNLEALACGTPVITYRTGGSPESIDELTGIVVEQGDVNGLSAAITKIQNNSDKYTIEQCRKRAEKWFNKDDCFKNYFSLYNELLDGVI